MQKCTAKMKSTRKTGSGALELQKSTLEKVNGQLSKSQSQRWKGQLPEVKVKLEMMSVMTRVGDDVNR